MNKIVLSCILIAGTFTPMVLAASETNAEDSQLQQYQSEKSETIDCSGRCQSCPDQSCPRRRRPYQGNNK